MATGTTGGFVDSAGQARQLASWDANVEVVRNIGICAECTDVSSALEAV